MTTKTKSLLHCEVIGEGYPVVFIHGFLESNSMWKNILPALPEIQAICVELPGHGASILPNISLSIPKMAAMIEKTISPLISNRSVILVGHSLGGYVGLEMVKRATLSVEHLVLLHSHPWEDTESKKKDRNRVVEIIKYNKRLFINEAVPNLYYLKLKCETEINETIEIAQEMSTDAIVQSTLAMRNRKDRSAILEKLGARCHIIQGEFDPLIDAHRMKRKTEVNKNSLHLIEGIGHMGHHEAPQKVISILKTLMS